ncbi:MAG: proteasome accessory factor PafA2 family protein [Planctomycetota bacterium]
MRIVGLETEYALGFSSDDPDAPAPQADEIFSALVRTLRGRHASSSALYYKGGRFFQNGSLLHFEIGSLENPRSGLLEWATPECLGPLEAAVYAKAQERALLRAIPDAERDLKARGYVGRIFVLKNNADRFGNAYGCHESYDVAERPAGAWQRFATWVLHPLALFAIALVGVLMALPLVGVLLSLLCLQLSSVVLGRIPGARRLAQALTEGVQRIAEFLVDVSDTPGSGLVGRVLLLFLWIGGGIFSCTARWVLFTGHLPALVPFLVTRPVFSGAGYLDPSGSFKLTQRADVISRSFSAFLGPRRPLIDAKEYLCRRPLSYRSPRKRLHLLAGDANRSEYAELLKLATTACVLDAIEGGALDQVARRIRLRGGPIAAFGRVAQDLGLQAVIAHDRITGEGLTALDVQRRYLEATWEFFRAKPEVEPELRDALARWAFVLDALSEGAHTLDSELDWVIKLKLLTATLQAALPEEEAPWETLAAWGPLNAALERRCPHLAVPPDTSGEEVLSALEEHLGWSSRSLVRSLSERGLDFARFPAVRLAFLRLKVVDLKYHELSSSQGFYDALLERGRIARVLDPETVARACLEPPSRTRATIRGALVGRYGDSRQVRVGWEKVVLEHGPEGPRTLHLDDPYRYELTHGEQDLLED